MNKSSKPRAWMCWSTGKDSAWALHLIRRENQIEVTGLLTTVTEPHGRVSMHGVRDEILVAQAVALGLPLHRVQIPDPCTRHDYDYAMLKVLNTAKNEGVTQVVFGDIYLEDVRKYRERQLAGTGISPCFPLWKKNTNALADEMTSSGLVAYVTCVDPKKMPGELAGSIFDSKFLARLPKTIDPCAETGEFHTCAVAGPMFLRPLSVELGETVERSGFVFADLLLKSDTFQACNHLDGSCGCPPEESLKKRIECTKGLHHGSVR